MRRDDSKVIAARASRDLMRLAGKSEVTKREVAAIQTVRTMCARLMKKV